MRLREAQRRAKESEAQKNQRLQDMRQRASQRRVEATLDRQTQRLEEDRRRYARRLEALRRSRLSTYKIATTTDNFYKSLQPFNVKCIHCKALHFPEEKVSNRTHRDFFDDCCLHGRIDLQHPEFPNELA